MKGFPVELLYLIAFGGVILFNYLLQRALRRRQEEEPQAQPEPPPAEDEPLEDIWGRTPAPAPVPAPLLVARAAPPAVRAEPPAPPRAHPLRAFLRDRRGLHRAIVLMTVLGPCRAQEPPER